MKYELTQELLNGVFQVIANSKSALFSYIEIDGLIKKLQALPKITEPAKENKENKEVKK